MGQSGLLDPEKQLRVIISKRRMNKQHPLIKELQKKVSITMVAFEPGQDGFFVFLGPKGGPPETE